MGTGPYMLDHWTRATEIVLNRNPIYWGGWEGKHPEKVVIKYADEPATRILALKNGDADFTYIPYTNLVDMLERYQMECHITIHKTMVYRCIIMIFLRQNKYLILRDILKIMISMIP